MKIITNLAQKNAKKARKKSAISATGKHEKIAPQAAPHLAASKKNLCCTLHPVFEGVVKKENGLI